MLDSLITSKTRARLLLKFFLNTDARAHLRGLADELGESTNAVRVELNRLAEAGLLESEDSGRMKIYRANIRHPLFPELRSIAAKTLGLDQVVEGVVKKLGRVELAFVTGDYAAGIDSGLIDLVLVGEIDREYFAALTAKVEALLVRKIRGLALTREEFDRLVPRFRGEPSLVVWNNGRGEKNGTDRLPGPSEESPRGLRTGTSLPSSLP